MSFRKYLLLLVCAVSMFLHACSSKQDDIQYYSQVNHKTLIPGVGQVPQRGWLEQGWNDEVREQFYFTSQGSRIIPYTWFTWLEQAENQNYFRDAAHMESLRYLPMKSSKRNPAGLPIGFVLAEDKTSNQAWMGMTCAACHTNQLDYGDKKLLIDGAPTLGNFVKFYSELVAALNATNKNDKKFERFARNVLGAQYSDSSKRELRERLLEVATAASMREVVNDLPDSYPEDFTSYARLDAFGNIQNAGTAFALHDVSNKNTPTGPVSYPFLWGTHQSDVVQWNASAPNTPVVGPLVRNIGEVVGVFGELEINKAAWWQIGKVRYSSSVDMLGLGHLESWVKTLRSPQWPQDILPPIDAMKASKGELLFQERCVSCHQVIPRDEEGEHYTAVKTPVEEVGTDPITAWNADYHISKSLILEGTKKEILIGDRFKKETASISVPVNGVVGIVLEDPFTALKAGLMPGAAGGEKSLETVAKNHERSTEDYLKEHLQARQQLRNNRTQDNPRLQDGVTKNLTGLVYKARPLNGIWSTAPYLHNGSVPNLEQLLVPPAKREKSFWVGSRTFDPVKVGYISNVGLSEFKVLDKKGNIQAGNSNLGHDYGTDLKPDQKKNLIEYMKTL